MTQPGVLRELLAQGRFAEVMDQATTVGPEDEHYPAARLIAVRAELLRGRVAAASELLDRSAASAFDGDDGAVLGLWREFVPALSLPRTIPDPLGQVGSTVDTAANDSTLRPRARATALALRARFTSVLVQYDELPRSALHTAADQFALAADANRSLGLHRDAWQLIELRCTALRGIPAEPIEPILDQLAAIAAEARGTDPIAEGMSRLAAFRIRLEEIFGSPDEIDVAAVSAECEAIGALLDRAGHAFGTEHAQWTAAKIMLRYGEAGVVDLAWECADAFTTAGAVHLAQEVGRDLADFHNRRGEGERQRAAVAQSATRSEDGQWVTTEYLDRLRHAGELLRAGNLRRAQEVVDTELRRAPHRQARTALRVQRTSRLAALGMVPAARDELGAALEDLAPVRPTPLTGEVLANLALLETDNLPTALRHASEAVDAALALADRAAASRYLVMRAQLRMFARRELGQWPTFTDDAEADLTAAVEVLPPRLTLEGQQAMIGVHQQRGLALFFDRRYEPAIACLHDAVELARGFGLGRDLAFALYYLATTFVSRAREIGSIELYDAAADAFTESRQLFLNADIAQSAWNPRFMVANAQWESARHDPVPSARQGRIEKALDLLEDVAIDIDVLRGAAGGSTAVERQQAAIGFVGDKQQAYQTGFRIAVQVENRDLALRWLERMKSRTLLDALASATLPSEGIADNPELRRERAVEDRRATAVDFGELSRIHQEHREILDRLTADPRTAGYAALRRSEPPDWSVIRDMLIDERRVADRRLVVAQYYTEPGSVLLFGMAPDWSQPRLSRIPCDPDQFAAFAATTFRVPGGVRMMMEDHTDGGVGAWQRFAPLVAPIAEWTGSEQDIVCLIPYGTLHDLPLHTLHVQPGLPLGLRNPVCYAPSLAVLRHTLGRAGEPARHAAVFGDPHGNLPWATDEARTAADALGVSAPVLGTEVTRAAVVTALRDRGTVHIAAHAHASVDDGLASGIELADGVLRAADLLLEQIRASLVVLSGCETGVSRHHPGDEAVGLVRVLLHGGARSMLTSQWRVRDDSARGLLNAFHRNHATMSSVDALRAAMLADADRHFYHWGGFVLVGDWR